MSCFPTGICVIEMYNVMISLASKNNFCLNFMEARRERFSKLLGPSFVAGFHMLCEGLRGELGEKLPANILSIEIHSAVKVKSNPVAKFRQEIDQSPGEGNLVIIGIAPTGIV